MTKTLYILRHAKADNQADYQDDHEKPLAKRGIKDCHSIANHLMNSPFGLPEVIMVSDALRTMQTAKHLMETLDDTHTPKCQPRSDLYLSTPGEILKALASVPSNVNRVLLLAHNPGCHQLSMLLAGEPTATSRPLFSSFPTGSLITFEVKSDDWQVVDAYCCKCTEVYFP